METRNAAIPHGHGLIRPGHFTPFAKNPTLSKFFMQMGRGEELGSGVLNVNKYLPFYAKGAKPRFIEGDPFVTVIPLSAESGPTGETSEKTSEKILAIIAARPDISARELAGRIGVTSRAVELQIRSLKKTGRLRRIGPAKGGHWEIGGAEPR